ncbi:unnamed protein product [Hyaloperonospora brassicae]|uniref:RxLR effector protein n=1 Tax=Hyaloperonospora brassicae TaxID=162125 RepID=A0AAV0USX0_HYABA|nr:unnamed protein product [Hyaloperonospora brassicae]
MRPYAILSTALLCLSACGNASAATLDSEQLMTSDVTSPAVAERNLVATDERAEHRRLFSWPWEDDEVKNKNTDKKTGKADSVEDKPKHRLFWYRPTYSLWFNVSGYTRKQALAKIEGNKHRRWFRDSSNFVHKGYLQYLKEKCAEDENKFRPACM